ncbi:hypothetical protein B0J13DRAFT_442200 [Dactylonectria estremocensis]|uniref:Uncharacterized protein n=1 Tax=Dactylonectria estremocensis TaxID=1079267 RepID=A0A9P9J332_9HYPO|nr:hypothetical protein B0J13DRAFT_442200 [Dactylonectria estremocensis]
MRSSTFLSALVGVATASSPVKFNSFKAGQKGLLLPGAGSQALNLAATNTCDIGETACRGGCMPLTGECCSTNTGYCDIGFYCMAEGCCEDGSVCTGSSSGCSDGYEICGDYCMPEGSVCCDTFFCDAGETCTSDGYCYSSDNSSGSCYSFQEECGDGCMPEGSVCCTTGYCYAGETCNNDGTCSLGGSGGDDDDSSGGSCYSYQEACGDGCMPEGSVCCDNGKYCLSGQTCVGDGTCTYGDDDSSVSSYSFIFTTASSVTVSSVTIASSSFTSASATAVSGDDSSSDSSSSDSSSSSSSSSNDGDNGAGIVGVPYAMLGLVGLIPLVL